ncbi:carbohydrate-binding module family 18 protein [Piromyces sp. E2]|nr:carbohydrate-binding module family 18 protein [Piromyces sp. E2]|eukprot:OUM64768.1 carbohydrate-binding module family 18 protein [Piromyces sp. E2]
MKRDNKILFFLLNSILLINITIAKGVKTSSNDDKVVTKKKSKDQKYLIYVNNTYGEFDIFSNPYNQKYVKRQELDSYEFAVSFMDKIDDLINENRDTFKNPEKLEEIENQIELSKRDNEDQPVDYYDNSYFVHPVLSLNNNIVISAYLSEELVKKITNMKNVRNILPEEELDPNATNYYNKVDILKESSWKDLTVQSNADLHLSVISQGLFIDNLVGQYDKNYYYPSSDGKGIDIIILDDGFDFGYSEFNNKDKRTAKCSVYFDSKKQPIIPKNSNSCGANKDSHGRKVADIAGGIKHGTAKLANIYGVAIPTNSEGKYELGYIYEALQYITNKMIRPNKTIINISLGSFWKSDNKEYNDSVNRITEKGGIVVVSAGNEGSNIIQSSEKYGPCYLSNTICVGGIQSNKLASVTNSYSKSKNSNYGKQVDIYAPYNVVVEFVDDGKVIKKNASGTSYSSPLTAGIIATIMSDNSNTKFTKSSILKYLLNDGTSFKVEGLTKMVVNNGKHIVYSSDGKYKGLSKVKDRCGPEYGRCAKSNECCSKYGWCDTKSEHYGKGCQPKYGICK